MSGSPRSSATSGRADATASSAAAPVGAAVTSQPCARRLMSQGAGQRRVVVHHGRRGLPDVVARASPSVLTGHEAIPSPRAVSRGTVSTIVRPPPGVSSAEIRARTAFARPAATATEAQAARARVVEPLEGLDVVVLRSSGTPGPVSATRRLHRVARGGGREQHLDARWRVPHRVDTELATTAGTGPGSVCAAGGPPARRAPGRPATARRRSSTTSSSDAARSAGRTAPVWMRLTGPGGWPMMCAGRRSARRRGRQDVAVLPVQLEVRRRTAQGPPAVLITARACAVVVRSAGEQRRAGALGAPRLGLGGSARTEAARSSTAAGLRAERIDHPPVRSRAAAGRNASESQAPASIRLRSRSGRLPGAAGRGVGAPHRSDRAARRGRPPTTANVHRSILGSALGRRKVWATRCTTPGRVLARQPRARPRRQRGASAAGTASWCATRPGRQSWRDGDGGHHEHGQREARRSSGLSMVSSPGPAARRTSCGTGRRQAAADGRATTAEQRHADHPRQ